MEKQIRSRNCFSTRKSTPLKNNSLLEEAILEMRRHAIEVKTMVEVNALDMQQHVLKKTNSVLEMTGRRQQKPMTSTCLSNAYENADV